MTAELLIPIGVVAVAILAAIAAFTIAWRRSGGAEWRSRVGRETREADRPAPAIDLGPVAAAETEPPTAEPLPVEPEPVAVAVASAQRVVEISPEESGVTRRSFFNRALGVLFLGGFLGGGLGLGFLSFFWPRLTGGFGTDVNAGDVNDLLDQAINDDGSVTPVFIPEAKAYIVPSPPVLSAQFEGQNVSAGGLMALYQRCVHLGCRVPWCQTSQGFECPCHGSKYNGVGEYFGGPAPRNLDRFVVEVSATNGLVIKTSQIIETPRALEKSVEYPKGVSCLGATAQNGGVV